jgi:hypothetical protein
MSTEAIRLGAEIFGVSEQEAEGWFAAQTAREAEGWSLDRSHQKARMYWGPSPLPSWSHFEGLVTRPDGRTGALIQLRRTGVYVQGIGGIINSIDQQAVKDLLGR